MGVKHKEILDADMHRPGVVSTSDPGSIGASLAWLRRVGGAVLVRIRTAGNDGWGRLTVEHEVQTVTADSHTLVLADTGKHLRLADPTGVDLIVPDNDTVGFPIGVTITIEQAGDGPVSIHADTSTVIASRDDHVTTAGVGAVAQLRKVDVDEWVVWGDLVS